MSRITQFTLKGYRAISTPITLTDLGTYVALYGDNAVGKSSLLQAVDLFGQLCATHPTELLGTGQPWPLDAFLERFRQDAWMFNSQASPVIELAATMDTLLDVSFRLTRVGQSIEVACTRAFLDGTDFAAQVPVARREVKIAEGYARTANPANDGLQEALAEANSRLTAAYEDLCQTLSPLRVAIGLSPVLPVPDPTRGALFDAMTSTDAALRTAVRSIMRRFGALFPALGAGEIDVLGNSPRHDKDLAWVTATSTIDLDHLGGGVQSAVATFASLLLSRAPIVCLEEPEAFVGSLALEGLSEIFRTAAAKGICE